jgi:hypothetical protein
MGPHYLQRVAIAGSRTSAEARPGVASPPQMPGSVWLSRYSIPADRELPAGAAEYAELQSRPASDSMRAPGFVENAHGFPRAADGEGRSKAEPAGDVEPAPSGEASVAGRSTERVRQGPQLLPVAPEQPWDAIRRILPVGHEASVTAPMGLRHVSKPPPAADAPRPYLHSSEAGEKPAAQAVIAGVAQARTQSDVFAARSQRSVLERAAATAGSPTLRSPSIAQAPMSPAESYIPAQPGTERGEADEAGAQGTVPGVPRPRTQSDAFALRGPRPMVDPTAAATDRRTLPSPSSAPAERSPAQGSIPALPGTERRSAAASGDRHHPVRFQSPTVAEATASGDLEPTAATRPLRSEPAETAALESRPVAPLPQTAAVATTPPGFVPKSHGLPVLPANPAPAARSESRITIGRVEVQVNNHSPQLPAISRSEPGRISRPASALLEAYYLARFSLRP